ncbi:hypothetical protein [Rhizobium laguerreae]|nr:hypothetical protein [Rhizobium laguerreae]MBY3434837.1 hypothetical protein [Rhizobium laguerreae]MBY3448980.1 hypothetical protein [Rhizobium laguerreae]MBY3456754.1 hypothetical protein [Rhizobium laguerreae]
MNIQLIADYSLVAVVAFVIVSGIVLSFCQQVEKEESSRAASRTARRP